MSSSGSVTAWLGQLQAGDETGLAKLHQRYGPYLVSLARKRLRGAPCRVADEDDVVQEAFWTFHQSLKAGQLPRLANRDHLLAFLSHLVACKAVNQIQHEVGTQKRGGGRVQSDSALDVLVKDDAPTPLEKAVLNDCYQHYLTGLPKALRPFAELYLAGCTQREIAEQLGCVDRTVVRKMPLILKKWQELAAQSMEDGDTDTR